MHEALATRHACQLSTITRVSRQLATFTALGKGALDTPAFQRFVAESEAELLGAHSAQFWSLEDGQDSLLLAASTTRAAPPFDGPSVDGGERLPKQGSLAGMTVALGRPCAVTNEASRRALHPIEEVVWKGYRSLLAVPVFIDRRVFGAVVVGYRTRRKPSATTVEMAEGFALQAAAALENSLLYNEASRRREQAEGMAEIARATTSSLELREVLGLALDTILEIMGLPAGIIYLRDELRDLLNVAAHRGLSIEYVEGVEGVRLGEGALGRVAASGQAELIDDVLTHPHIVRPVVRQEGLRSLVIVPLQAGPQVIGAMYVGRKIVQPFTAEQTSLLVAMGRQIAVAIENARLHGAAVRRSKELAALLRAGRTVMAGLDLQVILKQIVGEAAAIAGTPRVQLLLVDEQGDALRLAAATGGQVDSEFELRVGSGCSGRVAATGRPLFISDLRSSPDHCREERQPGQVTYLGLPVKVRERVVGVLVFTTERPKSYSTDDLEYLASFADQAAIAIENARLFEQVAKIEALRELTRLKSEFLGTVSHELRTPLSLIVGYAELLARRADRLSPKQVAEMVSEIEAGSRTMVRLVDDLLDFARLEQGRLKFQPQTITVNDLLGRLVESFRVQPGGERISANLEHDLSAHLDPERFSQVVNNLVTNAQRYAPEGPILVSAVRRNAQIVIEVTDRGPGIPVDEQARIWERFYRGARALTQTNRGSGLGLAVVKHLVELHGGEVGVRSSPGHGSTFWFTLPTEQESSAASHAA